MSEDIVGSTGFLLVLLILSFFFSGTETSITAVGRGKLLALSDLHPPRRGLLSWLLGNTQRALTVTLVGNNLVNIAASSLATSLAIAFFGVITSPDRVSPPRSVFTSTYWPVFGSLKPKKLQLIGLYQREAIVSL